MEEEVDESDLMDIHPKLYIKSILRAIDSTDEVCEEVNNLTLKKLQEGVSLADNFESFFLNAERSRKFKRELQNCLSPY